MKTTKDLQNIGEEFFRLIREKEAWKEISKSSDIPWSDKLVEKYADKLDWEELCDNPSFNWSIELIEKYSHKIDWDNLSENILRSPFSDSFVKVVDWAVIKRFEGSWNWHKLSRFCDNFTEETLEQFANNLDWGEIIDNRDITWSYRLYEKFRQYIPINNLERFQDSYLWESIIEFDAKILEGEMLKEAMND